MEAAIFALLTGNAGVSALVGANVFPQEAQTNAVKPFITYLRNDGANLGSFSGRGGLNRATFDVRCFGSTQAETKSISDAVEVACDVLKQTIGGVDVQAIDVTDVRDELIQGKEQTGDPSWARVVAISGFWK